MDLIFYMLQLGFFYMDFDLISKSIDKAKNLFEEGGDWERKNHLKVYEGLFRLSISTFMTYEFSPYDTFIFYTVITSIISLDRVSLKQKVVDAPEILTVIGKIPHMSDFLNSLYDCRWSCGSYKIGPLFASSFPVLHEGGQSCCAFPSSRNLASATIEAMAKAFGVSVDFIDLELSRFIAAGKPH